MSYIARLSIISILGVLLSAYLSFHFVEVRGDFLVGDSFCNITEQFNCDSVVRSPYAEFLGQPVSSWALVYYLVFLGLLGVSRREESHSSASAAIFVYALLSLLPSLVLFFLALLVIKKYCLFCLMLDVCNLALCLVAFNFWRSASTLSLPQGVPALCSKFLSFNSDKGISSGLKLLLVLLLSISCSLALPSLFKDYYFIPRQQQMIGAAIDLPFSVWKSSPVEYQKMETELSAAQSDFTLGPPTAAAKLVMFADLECPTCKYTAKILEDFVKSPKSAGKVSLTLKNFPLDSSCNPLLNGKKHEFACRLAYYSRCAGAQKEELFWEMHRRIINTNSWTEESLESLPLEFQLEQSAFSACIAGEEVRNKVLADIEEGIRLKLNSTPTIFINGKKVTLQAELLPGLLMAIANFKHQSGE